MTVKAIAMLNTPVTMILPESKIKRHPSTYFKTPPEKRLGYLKDGNVVFSSSQHNLEFKVNKTTTLLIVMFSQRVILGQ